MRTHFSLGHLFAPDNIKLPATIFALVSVTLCNNATASQDPPPDPHDVNYIEKACFALANNVTRAYDYIKFECVEFYLDQCVSLLNKNIDAISQKFPGWLQEVDQLACIRDRIAHNGTKRDSVFRDWCDKIDVDGGRQSTVSALRFYPDTVNNSRLSPLLEEFTGPHSTTHCGPTTTPLLYIGIGIAVVFLLGFAFLRLQKWRSEQAAEDTKAAHLLPDTDGDDDRIIEVRPADDEKLTARTNLSSVPAGSNSRLGCYGSFHMRIGSTEMTPVAGLQGSNSSTSYQNTPF